MKYILLFFGLLFHTYAYSQTAGLSNVTAIEGFSVTYEGNKNKIAQMNSEIPEMEIAWRKKIDVLKSELATLYRERDALIADMKVGARCSQCNGWKSEFEKRGENFEKHLGEVKGYAVPATTNELESVRKQFSEKVAIKKVQIQNLEKGDIAVLNKKKSITSLEEQNNKICASVGERSKAYEEAVLNEMKTKHDTWFSELGVFAVANLVANDRLMITDAKLVGYDKEFLEEKQSTDKKLTDDNLARQEEKKSQQIKADTRERQLIAEKQKLLNALSQKRTLHVQTLEEIKSQTLGADSSKLKVLSEQNIVNINGIKNADFEVQKQTQRYNFSLDSLKTVKKNLTADLVALQLELPSKLAKKSGQLKASYDTKKQAALLSKEGLTQNLANSKIDYNNKLSAIKTRQNGFISQINIEMGRILTASQKMNCSIFNEVLGKVNLNWTQNVTCFSSIQNMAKTSVNGVFSAYCQEKIETYFSNYKSFLNSLNESELNILKNITNRYFFEQVSPR